MASFASDEKVTLLPDPGVPDDEGPTERLVRHDHLYSEVSIGPLSSPDSDFCAQQFDLSRVEAYEEVATCGDFATEPANTEMSFNNLPDSNPDLSTRAEGLAAAREFLRDRVKPSTQNQYDRVYCLWQAYCLENDLPELGLGHEDVAACLSLVMKRTGSFHKVSMLSAAISNEYRRNLQDSPTEHRCISDLLKVFKNRCQNARQPMLPITEDMVKQMMDTVYHPSNGRDGLKASLVLWRTVWRVLMEYYTLGRFSDIVRLQRSGKAIFHGQARCCVKSLFVFVLLYLFK